jgi:HEAT repeat protein
VDESKVDPAQLVPLLLEALDDPEDGVGSKSQNALWMTIQPGQFPLVLGAAKDKRPRVRSRSFLLFGKFRTEAKTAVPVLVDALQDEDAPVRRAAAQALSYFGSEKETLAALLKAMDDPDRPGGEGQMSVAEWAVSSLGACRKLNPPLVLSTLARVARTGKTRSMRLGATVSLGAMGACGDEFTKEVLPILSGFLKDEDPWLRAQAAGALSNMRVHAAPAMPALLEALDTRGVTDPALAKNIRLSVMSALWGIGPGAKDAVPVLIEIAQSQKNDPAERRYAVSALGSIGEAAKQAIPLLKRIMVAEKDFGLRQSAQSAVRLLER